MNLTFDRIGSGEIHIEHDQSGSVVKAPYILKRDENGAVMWRPGTAPLLTPQQRTDAFSYEHIPPEIEVPLGFQTWIGGAGFEEVSSSDLNALSVYNYTQGVDLSWGERGYLSPELQTGGTVATTNPKKFLWSDELGLFSINDRFVYEWTGSAWTERFDVGASGFINDLAEFTNSNDTYLLVGIRANPYQFSTDGASWGTSDAAGAVAAFRSTANATGSSVSAITITKPAGTVDDDIMIAHIGSNVSTATGPAGWTQITSATGGGQVSTLLWKRASSEGANYEFTISGSSNMRGVITSYSGCITSGAPYDASSAVTNTTTTSHVATAVTTVGADRLVIAMYSVVHATATWTAPASYTERYDGVNNGFSQSGHTITQAAAGSTGAVTATASDTSTGTAFLIALIPSSPAGASDVERFAVRGSLSGEPVLWAINSLGDMRNAIDPTTPSDWSGADDIQVGQDAFTISGMEVIDNTFYVFRDTEITSYDGLTVSTVYSSPTFKLATDAARPFLWVDGHIYFTYNHQLFQFNATNNQITPIWPAPLGNAELNGTITAITGDENHLYFAVKNIAGNTYTMKGDPRRPITVGTGIVHPFHTWAYRGTGDALALLVVPADSDAMSSTNPHLVLGDDASADYFILPRAGFRPEDDPNYRFDTTADRIAIGPFMDWGARAFNKFLNRGIIVGDDLDSDDTITLQYQTPSSFITELDNLAGYWPMGETSGNALDGSTNSNDGTVTLGAGARDALALDIGGDGSIEFDGANTQVRIADDSAIQNIFDGGGSIFFMFDADSDGESDLGVVVGKSTLPNLFVWGQSGSFIRLELLYDTSGGSGEWATDTNIPINTTIIGVVTYDADSVDNNPIFYLWDGTSLTTRTVGNGLTELSTPVGARVSNVGDTLVIGNDENNQDETFDGHIDEIALYTDVLTATEAIALISRARAVVIANSDGQTEGILSTEVEFQTLRWVALLNNGANTTTPILQGLVFHATLNPPRKRIWNFTVDLPPKGNDQDGRFLASHLFNALNERVTLYDMEGNSFLVRILDIQGIGATIENEGLHQALTVVAVQI